MLRHLVQTLRSDLNLLSTETRKKYPAVREVRDLLWAVLVRGALFAGLEVVSRASLLPHLACETSRDDRSDSFRGTDVGFLVNCGLVGAAMNQRFSSRHTGSTQHARGGHSIKHHSHSCDRAS